MIAALKVQSVALEVIRKTFRERGFVEIMPIILSTATDPLGPDPNSSIIGIPEIEYQGQKLVLTQSMILHKQIIVSSGIKKFFIVSPNVRLEHAESRSTGCHLFEFSQLDFEIANAKMSQVFNLVEDIITAIIDQVRKECSGELAVWDRELCVPNRFEIYNTEELIERYGYDWEQIVSRDSIDPFWVLNHKREFYDAEDLERPGTYLNYDMIYPEGFGEALSGAEREWDIDRIIMRIERDGFNVEDYEPYLKFARRGFVPSAGAGLGVERLTRFLVGASHVGDVQTFRRVPGEVVLV